MTDFPTTFFEANEYEFDLTKLDPDLKTRWVEALRSGRYKHGKQNLCAYNAYCCLGVLAHIDGKLVAIDPDYSYFVDRDFSADEHSSTLPDSYLYHLNLNHEVAEMLMAWNDDVKTDSFHDIANWIDENL